LRIPLVLKVGVISQSANNWPLFIGCQLKRLREATRRTKRQVRNLDPVSLMTSTHELDRTLSHIRMSGQRDRYHDVHAFRFGCPGSMNEVIVPGGFSPF
jgi:hypothetical protein